MLKIYHAPLTRGIRVIWLCEEAQVDYEVEHIDFSQAFRSRPEWRAISPIGKLPIMEDGEIRIFESGAMVQYVLDRYTSGELAPKPHEEHYAAYLQWVWFAEATLARPLGEIVNHNRSFPNEAGIPVIKAEMADRAVACLGAVADAVADRPYLLGESFSAADIMMGYSIYLAHKLIPEQVPAALDDYWQRLARRPAFEIASTR